jgi:hypothetical protein
VIYLSLGLFVVYPSLFQFLLEQLLGVGPDGCGGPLW